MRVVPESMIVSKLETAAVEPTRAFAPVACQKPVDVSMEWYSMEPVYLEVSVPPRKRFQMVSPKAEAWSSDEKLAAPVAPPSESVTILPRDWQNSMSEARKLQSGRLVPGKTESSTALQICQT